MSETKSDQFKALHYKEASLILNNIWDVPSAIIQEKHGAKAVATSSAAMAWSLGYADGYQLPVKLLLESIQRIQRTISIPLSVDIENGYSDDVNDVASLVKELVALGVAGINIEDGNGSPELLCKKITAIKEVAPLLFINARTDVYLAQLVPTEMQESETQKRLELYLTAGCDGLFIPGLSDANLAANWQENLAHGSTKVPVNLMAGGASQMETFKQAGIKRISMGPGSFIAAYSALINTDEALPLSYEAMNSFFSG